MCVCEKRMYVSYISSIVCMYNVLYVYVRMYVRILEGGGYPGQKRALDCCSEGRGECVCLRGSGVVMMVKLLL